jgi:tetratricopeptide (TPR) repeat protein
MIARSSRLAAAAVLLAAIVLATAASAQTPQDSAAALMQAGREAQAAKQFARAADLFVQAAALAPNPAAIYNAAASYALAGHRERALEWLDRTVNTGFIAASIIAGDTAFASLRGEARYHGALATAKRLTEPCRESTDARRFDFWVGSWNVTTVQGQPVGSSRVDIVSGGCGLLENWTSLGGAEGKSLNAFNRRTQKWQQYWVGPTGDVAEFLDSEWRDGALVLSGAGSSRDGRPRHSRLTFRPLPNGSVQQLGEASTDGGKTWTVTFDYRYVRRP